MFPALHAWWAQPHFWFAVVAPALVAIAVALRNGAELAENRRIWVIATILTVASTYFDMRSLVGLPPDPYGVYALSVFPVAYLIAGQYRVASAAVCFAGTYGSLLATDLVVFAAGIGVRVEFFSRLQILVWCKAWMGLLEVPSWGARQVTPTKAGYDQERSWSLAMC